MLRIKGNLADSQSIITKADLIKPKYPAAALMSAIGGKITGGVTGAVQAVYDKANEALENTARKVIMVLFL